MSAVAPAATGAERLVPPHVSHANSPPSGVALSVLSPDEYAPSATTSTPLAPVAPGPRFDHTITSLSGTWPIRAIESQPVPPNCVEAPTAIPAIGDGGAVVP